MLLFLAKCKRIKKRDERNKVTALIMPRAIWPARAIARFASLPLELNSSIIHGFRHRYSFPPPLWIKKRVQIVAVIIISSSIIHRMREHAYTIYIIQKGNK